MGYRNETDAAQARANALERKLADKESELSDARDEIERLRRGKPRLVELSAGTSFDFDKTELTIGRTDDNDITINHRSLSRRHARFAQEGEHWIIQDLGSANGVSVNGDEVSTSRLAAGDIIEFGNVRLRFVSAQEHYEWVPGGDVQARNATGSSKAAMMAIVAALVIIAAIGAVVMLAL